jgi:hypothetical protein
MNGPGSGLVAENPTGFYCLDLCVPAERDACVRLLELRAEQVCMRDTCMHVCVCVCVYIRAYHSQVGFSSFQSAMHISSVYM